MKLKAKTPTTKEPLSEKEIEDRMRIMANFLIDIIIEKHNNGLLKKPGNLATIK